MYHHSTMSLMSETNRLSRIWTAAKDKAPIPVNVPEADIRHDLVARIRSEIEAGTYDTPEKLSIALERMIDDVNE